MTRRVLSLVLAAAVAAAAAPAAATFHLIKIREVFPGTTAQPDAEYVLLQMYQAGQNQLNGHHLEFFDATGASLGEVELTANVANAASQSFILLASPAAETLFGVAADFSLGEVMDPAGGMVCFEDVDCVSWGAYAGSVLSPSPSGTPFGPNGGIVPGHAIQRDISHGNVSLLQDSDDTDDSLADFACMATAEPINNAGATGSYTDPTPCPVCGNDSLETGEVCDGTDDLACVGGCQSDCTCPSHDAVVLPLKPLKLKVPVGMPGTATKKVKIKVVNGDLHPGADSIQLAASTGDCPPGVSITTPDFNPPSLDDSVNLGSGASAKAVATVTVSSDAFTVLSRKALRRCTLLLTASTVETGNLDPRPSNDSVPLEINVVDANDTVQNTSPDHESYVLSVKPLKVAIGAGSASALKKTKVGLGNADILPAADSGDNITLGVDVSACPGVSVATLDADKGTDGNQSSVPVDGGKVKKGLVELSFSASITTPSAVSPYRCIATLTATGPSDPDPDTTNNETQLVIDIIDKNDL